MMFHVPEKYRITSGRFGSDRSYGNNGAFSLTGIKFPRAINCIASDQWGWEHVSVSLPYRCPTWIEMCSVKDIFWDDHDLVMQLHPPKSDYVNNHPLCLHLWRKAGSNDYCEIPPSIMVGLKEQQF